MSNIRVLLADDHTIVRKGLRSLLEGKAGIEIVGEAQDGREALQKCAQLHPEVVLIDIAMPGLNGIEAIRQIKHRFPEIHTLVLTMHDDIEYIRQALHAGASGYVVKQAAPTDLVLAIQAAHRGDCYLSPSIAGKVVQEYIQRDLDEIVRYDQLTSRQREVLQLIAEGHSTREIAELLTISVKTVETHRANLMDKLDIHTTAGLTQYAIQKGIIWPDT
jgi:DNA-binding NarL/FixJ family response regulator